MKKLLTATVAAMFSLAAILTLFGCSSHPVKDEYSWGPELINTVKLDYPEEAKRKGIKGDVKVKMRVDTLGRVRQAMIEGNPDPLLIEPALKAALETRYHPAVLNGQRIAVWLISSFHFPPDE